MDEQLLPLLDLVPAHGADAALGDLSTQLGTRTHEGLTELRRLHDAAGLPAENPHKGMPMPGMVTPEQVTAAAATTGPAFDALLRTHLAAHFEQSANLIDSLLKTDSPPEIVALAGTRKATAEFALDSLS
ncbi:DUF305 domain-containing protein [Actinoplanes sp. NPDC023714]|uniref:DUF305 domain-containing protein n=1 Tax=Actinoplanes sp. NPDC023714 TaxID=3154322 RepID=UPI0033F566DB